VTAASPSPAPAADLGAAPVRWAPWFWPALIATAAIDLATKSLVFGMHPLSLPTWMEHHYNTGVAWSLLDRHPEIVTGLTLVLIPFLTWVWWSGYRKLGRVENLAFGLILGGALGNGYDRVLARFGHWPGVRDFLHVDLGFPPFDPWPTFNVADSGITVGFILLLAKALWPARRQAPSPVSSPPCT
jgi:signal peptidase II